MLTCILKVIVDLKNYVYSDNSQYKKHILLLQARCLFDITTIKKLTDNILVYDVIIRHLYVIRSLSRFIIKNL